jgi:hypothetical protein
LRWQKSHASESGQWVRTQRRTERATDAPIGRILGRDPARDLQRLIGATQGSLAV